LKTGREYMAVDNVGQCTYQCGLGQAGSNMLALTQTSGASAKAQVFQPMPTQPIEPDGIVGGIVANQKTGALYISHSALANAKGRLTGGSDANGNDNAVVVDIFPKGYSQSAATPIPTGSISLCKPYNPAGPCTSSTVYTGPLAANGSSKVTVGQDFTPVAVDHNGDIYVVWAQSPVNPKTGLIDGPTTVYMAVSTNQGRSWTKPIDVSGRIRNLKTNLFPAVAAAGRGGVDVAWYGTPTLGNCAAKGGCGSSAIKASWNVYMAQSLNTVTRSGKANPRPAFRTARVTEYPNHYGAICTMGIGCSTGGDRGLLDFIQVQADPSGAANVVWADSANTNGAGGTSAATIGFARQIAGPGLLGRPVHGPAPARGCAPGAPHGYYSANGSETAGTANMQILRSCISGPNAAGNYVVTMTVANLGSLSVPASEGGPVATWLTRWELPTPHPSFANQGHVFYAAMEAAGGLLPTFYAGETSTLGSSPVSGAGQGFFMTYSPEKTVTGTYTAGSPGTITINVPAADVGNQARRRLTLYSVTGMTTTQAEPSSLSGVIAASVFNLIDASAPYDAN
ncbi:MAG: sialidase family protein, partial [Acidimicrobiales bacterium]